MSTPGIPLQIFKDLHMYGECPTSMMFMGTIVGMPILSLLQDIAGLCMDYW
jgi:hypothetical protein